jgi:hypothetical protein
MWRDDVGADDTRECYPEAVERPGDAQHLRAVLRGPRLCGQVGRDAPLSVEACAHQRVKEQEQRPGLRPGGEHHEDPGERYVDREGEPSADLVREPRPEVRRGHCEQACDRHPERQVAERDVKICQQIRDDERVERDAHGVKEPTEGCRERYIPVRRRQGLGGVPGDDVLETSRVGVLGLKKAYGWCHFQRYGVRRTGYILVF